MKVTLVHAAVLELESDGVKVIATYSPQSPLNHRENFERALADCHERAEAHYDEYSRDDFARADFLVERLTDQGYGILHSRDGSVDDL